MPDISMCIGEDCPMKKDCYRYRAIPHIRQTFFTIPPREGTNCKHFWQLEKGHRIRCMDEIKEHIELPDDEAVDGSASHSRIPT